MADNVVSSAVEQLSKLNVSAGTRPRAPEDKLPVKPPSDSLEWRQRPVASATACPTFTNHKLLKEFSISEDGQCLDNVEIPTLIRKETWAQLIGTNLSTDFESATMLERYKPYGELKQEHFLKWIIKSNYFERVKNGEFKKPTFICFGGRICDPMITPCIQKWGDWTIYAVKFKDVIYLWKERTGSEDPQSQTHRLFAYYGLYLEHILTNENPKSKGPPNEWNKVHTINEITFGSHQILGLHEIDGKDPENGEWVEIKSKKEWENFRGALDVKNLNYWSQSIVPGVRNIVIGKHSGGKLVKIDEIKTNDLPNQASWKPEMLYEFQDRLMKWIALHLEKNDPKIVKKISWRTGEKFVSCKVVPDNEIPKNLLPEWYQR